MYALKLYSSSKNNCGVLPWETFGLMGEIWSPLSISDTNFSSILYKRGKFHVSPIFIICPLEKNDCVELCTLKALERYIFGDIRWVSWASLISNMSFYKWVQFLLNWSHLPIGLSSIRHMQHWLAYLRTVQHLQLAKRDRYGQDPRIRCREHRSPASCMRMPLDVSCLLSSIWAWYKHLTFENFPVLLSLPVKRRIWFLRFFWFICSYLHV